MALSDKEYIAILEKRQEEWRLEVDRLRELLEAPGHHLPRMEEVLTRHYKEPVRPVSHYCNAFYAWRKAIADALERGDFRSVRSVKALGLDTEEEWSRVLSALNCLEIPIAKSNLLHRLIYIGEPLRLTPCPEHKGHWSGCGDECEYGCNSGSNVTGWIPNP